MSNFLPVTPPIGVYKNGTPYSARGRWGDSDKVRFHDGAIRPIGGRSRLADSSGVAMPSLVSDSSTETIRDMLAWTDNILARHVVFCSNTSVYNINNDNTISDITPVGYVGGNNQPLSDQGFGYGLFGRGLYGTPRTGGGMSVGPTIRWFIDSWGEDVVLTDTRDSLVYSYTIGDPAALAVPNAPTDLIGIIVTDQRFVMGITRERTIVWSDKENREVWAAGVNNEAGSLFRTGVGEFRSILKIGDAVLVLSATDAHIGNYLGPPYVYGFKTASTGCGIVAAKAGVVSGERAFWLGERQIWEYNGGVRAVPCEVMDFFYHDKANGMDSKIVAVATPEFNEVTWLYQSKTGSEPDSYITYNYELQHWTVGTTARTAGDKKGATPFPLMVDADGYIWQHEQQGVFIEGAYIESGPLELDAGDTNMAVRAIMPDTSLADEVSFTLKGKQGPTNTEYSYGPYAFASPKNTRAEGREIRIRIDLLTVDAEIGTFRMDVAPTRTGSR